MKPPSEESFHGATHTEKEKLARWLALWETDRILSREASVESNEDRRASAPYKIKRIRADSPPLTESEPTELRVGAIVLLKPMIPPLRERLLYAAIVQIESSGSVVLCPFSRFPEPATPGEWITSCSAPALRVLCLWNTWSVSPSFLDISWPIGRLSAADRANVRRLLEWQAGQKPFPEKLATRIGPRLVHPLDPREAYLQQELEFRNQLLGALGEQIKRDKDDTLLMAAETPGRYFAGTGVLRLEGRPLQLLTFRSRIPGRHEIRVVDTKGNPSRELDGLFLVTTNQQRTAPIRKGLLRVDSKLLRDADRLEGPGHPPIPLRPTRGDS